VSTVNVVAPVLALPAASVPRTVTVWLPSASAAAGVNGEVHAANAAASTWHSIVVAPVTVSATLGRLLRVGDGTAVTVTTGGVVSTVNVVTPVLALPAASVPRTVTVWLPSASAAAGVNGEVHAANAAASTWHSIVVAPVTVNATLGRLLRVGLATAVTVTTGATVSTVNVVAPVPALPAASVPRTVTVWLPSASAAAGVNGEVHAANAPLSIWHWIVVA